MFFLSVPGYIVQGLSTEQACEVGAMTDGNISNPKRCYYGIYCPDKPTKERLNCLNSHKLWIG